MDIIILRSFTPECFFSVGILLLLLFNVTVRTNLKNNFCIQDKEVLGHTFFVLISLILIYFNLRIEGFFSTFLFINDLSVTYLKVTFSFMCALVLIILYPSFVSQKLNFFEFFFFYLFAVFSLLLLLSSFDLISFYLLLEMQSLCFYVLASFCRDSSFSAESGLKYFVSGAFISGILLFGCTLVYGTLGTLNLNNLSILLAFPFHNFNFEFFFFLLCGVVCITSALLFKLSCAPFHFWSPDVYDGAPLSSTIIFSTIPKISLLHFFFKWNCCLSAFFGQLNFVLLLFGVVSIFTGTFYAISQKRLKKLLIYSSISQIGFLIACSSLNTYDGYIHFFFFLFIYLITSVTIWGLYSSFSYFQYLVSNTEKDSFHTFFISSLTGLFNLHRIWGFVFIISFFSVAGIPPLAGFISKSFILFSIVGNGYFLFPCVIILLSSISTFYYIRVLKILFFEPRLMLRTYNKSLVIFYLPLLNNMYSILSSLLFCIFYFFFFPTGLLLFCEFVVINSFFL